MFGFFGKRSERQILTCIDDLTRLFPDFLDIAKGFSGTEKVPDVVSFHPAILGFLHGFGFTMVSVASTKLGFTEETQYRIVYQAIGNTLNRSDEAQQIGYRIIQLQDMDDQEFVEYEELGCQFLLGLSSGEEVRYMGMQPLLPHLGGKVFSILEKNGLAKL